MKFRSPLGNKLVEQIIIGAFIVGMLVFFGIKDARSAEIDPTVRIEGGATVVRGATSAMNLAVTWPGAGPHDADFACGTGLVGSSTFKGGQQANQAVLFCQIVDGYGRLSAGVGPAFLQNQDAYNGSHFNFTLMLGWRLTEHWHITLRHFSNAGTKKPNKGRDMLYAAYEF